MSATCRRRFNVSLTGFRDGMIGSALFFSSLVNIGAGCERRSLAIEAARSFERSDPALKVLKNFGRGLPFSNAKDFSRYVSVFSARCRRYCMGFSARTIDRSGGYRIAHWRRRRFGGTLIFDPRGPHGLGDLTVAIASYARVDLFVFHPLRMRRFRGRALFRARLIIRGIDRAGSRRTDEGIVDLDLREISEIWRIDSLSIVRARTVLRGDSAYLAGPRSTRDLQGSSGRGKEGSSAVEQQSGPWRAGPIRHLLEISDEQLALLEARGKELLLRPLIPAGESSSTRLSHVDCGAIRDLAVADFDADGDAEIFVACQGAGSGLYDDDGSGYRLKRELPIRSTITSGRVADTNGDGFLDLILTGRSASERNRGDLCDATNMVLLGPPARWSPPAAARIALPGASRRGIETCPGDLDGDGRIDLLLMDEKMSPIVMRGLGDGRFKVVQTLGSQASRCALGDVDNDGRLDVFIGVRGSRAGYLMRRSPFLFGAERRVGEEIARGGGLWLNRSQPGVLRFVPSPAFATARGWTGWASFLDHDSDGDLDLWRRRLEASEVDELRWFWHVSAVTGWRHPWSAKIPGMAPGWLSWRGQELWIGFRGGDFAEGGYVARLPQDGQGSGIAVDIDHDGRLDLLGEEAVVTWRGTDKEEGRSVILRLSAPQSRNRDAIGAVVSIKGDGGRQHRVVGVAPGWPGAPPGWIHVGLGSSLRIAHLSITWPGGRRDIHEDLPVDRVIKFEPGGHPHWRSLDSLGAVTIPEIRSRAAVLDDGKKNIGSVLAQVLSIKVGNSPSDFAPLSARVQRGQFLVVLARVGNKESICDKLRPKLLARTIFVLSGSAPYCKGELQTLEGKINEFAPFLPLIAHVRDGNVVNVWLAGAMPQGGAEILRWQ